MSKTVGFFDDSKVGLAFVLVSLIPAGVEAGQADFLPRGLVVGSSVDAMARTDSSVAYAAARCSAVARDLSTMTEPHMTWRRPAPSDISAWIAMGPPAFAAR